MRIFFAGSPAIAVPALEELFKLTQLSPDFELAAILTNPDSPKGRSGISLPTEIGSAAERLSAEYGGRGRPAPLILKPLRLDEQARDCIARLKPDLLVSFACGRIFGPKFLGLFPAGGINIHPSLLPKYRGPTPISAAILAGDTETGISIQRIALEVDSGDILAQERMPLSGSETAAGLSDIMAKKAAQMLPSVLKDILSGRAQGRPQNSAEVSYCSLINKDDGIIDWNMSAKKIDAQIRAYNPWPLSLTACGNQQLFILHARAMEAESTVIQETQTVVSRLPGMVLGIDKQWGILVQTGEGLIAVSELQCCAKKALHWKDFLNGMRNFIGSRLGSEQG